MSTPSSSTFSLLSPFEDYFSIADVLSSQQRVPCVFELPVYRMGFLNPSSDGEHLQVGTKMELPLWLAKVLSARRRQVVSVELPKVYHEAQREILGADPNAVDLCKLAPHYYSFGTKLLNLRFLERPELASSLLKTFQGRFRKIMDTSQNASRQDSSLLSSRLEEWEKNLFHIGHTSVSKMESWERGNNAILSAPAAIMQQGRRKRRRSDE